MDFEGKVVLVTGGASGLGRVLVDMFVEEGAKVVFTYLRSEEKARILAERHGDAVLALRADVSDWERAGEVVKETAERFGRVDALVNNAAAARHAAFLKLSVEDLDYTYMNTLRPVFNYSQAVAPVMAAQGGGSIVSIGSINGARGREGSAPYSAMKAAVVGLSKTIAKELGEKNVRANVIEPGYIATEGQEKTSPLIQKLVLDECAIRRLTAPEDVGNLVLFLASERARNITGQVYRIDCGQYI